MRFLLLTVCSAQLTNLIDFDTTFSHFLFRCRCQSVVSQRRFLDGSLSIQMLKDGYSVVQKIGSSHDCAYRSLPLEVDNLKFNAK